MTRKLTSASQVEVDWDVHSKYDCWASSLQRSIFKSMVYSDGMVNQALLVIGSAANVKSALRACDKDS